MPTPALAPRSATSLSLISAMVMSSFSAIQPRIASRWISSFEPFGCPRGLATREPVSRARRTQTMAVAMPTPKRDAAERAESASFSDASITRSRKSWLQARDMIHFPLRTRRNQTSSDLGTAI